MMTDTASLFPAHFFHPVSWLCGHEGYHHRQGFGQHTGNSDGEDNAKHCLAEKAGHCPWLANEQEGAEEAKQQRTREGTGDAPVVGLDYRSIAVLNEELLHYHSDCRKEESKSSQYNSQELFV